MTLGKEAMCAECQVLDTRQTKACLQSVMAGALGKQGHVCRVPRPLDTLQMRPDRFRAVMLLFFLPSVCFSTWQSLSDKKTLGKETFAGTVDVECRLPSVTLGKAFAECFLGFAVCLGHTAKVLFPVVHAFSKRHVESNPIKKAKKY